MDGARIVVNFSNAYFSSKKGQYKDMQPKLGLILDIFRQKTICAPWKQKNLPTDLHKCHPNLTHIHTR